MPVVAYYLGRPALIWIAAMSGSARAIPANPAAAAPRPAGVRVGRAAKGAGGDQCTRSHGRKHQPWGSLGQQLVHPVNPAPPGPH
jgi:hypothetical protein